MALVSVGINVIAYPNDEIERVGSVCLRDLPGDSDAVAVASAPVTQQGNPELVLHWRCAEDRSRVDERSSGDRDKRAQDLPARKQSILNFIHTANLHFFSINLNSAP